VMALSPAGEGWSFAVRDAQPLYAPPRHWVCVTGVLCPDGHLFRLRGSPLPFDAWVYNHVPCRGRGKV
jgi:hypothetical protein